VADMLDSSQNREKMTTPGEKKRRQWKYQKREKWKNKKPTGKLGQ
jgi:hypothetical protein